jgi:splicing suppressor protein 51
MSSGNDDHDFFRHVLRFRWNWCIVCAEDGEGGRLQRCGRCRIAGYCSVKCQQKHWPTHKLMCDGLRQLGRNQGPPTPSVIPFGRQRNSEWQRRLNEHAQTVDVPANQRYDIFCIAACLPKCSVCLCGSIEHLRVCGTCKLAWWCSAHADSEEAAEHRKSRCRRLADGRSMEQQLARGFRAVLVDGPTTPVPNSWSDYLRGVKSPRASLIAGGLARNSGLLFVAENITANALSGPLSVVRALRQHCHDLLQRTTLCIHVLGATMEEVRKTEAGWEEVLHCLPKLKTLNVCHVGAGISLQDLPADSGARSVKALSMQCCPVCVAAGRSRKETFCHGLWYQLRDHLPPADFFFAPNCGFHDDNFRPTWLPTLERLPSGTPLLSTCYNVEESMLDAVALTACEFNVVARGVNPFASTIEQYDPTTVDGLFADNACYVFARRA